jgi:hypothetical protein
MMENSRVKDIYTGGLVARPTEENVALASGIYLFECYDKDGNLKWKDQAKNLVVSTGLQFMANSLDAATTISLWYIGLKDSGVVVASNTMATGSRAWSENVTYSDATRPVANFAAATTASPSVVTNSANKAVFNINGTTTVYGAFLTSDSTKSGTTGTLFSAGDFSSSRAVVNGDTLQVTYQFSLSA